MTEPGADVERVARLRAAQEIARRCIHGPDKRIYTGANRHNLAWLGLACENCIADALLTHAREARRLALEEAAHIAEWSNGADYEAIANALRARAQAAPGEEGKP